VPVMKRRCGRAIPFRNFFGTSLNRGFSRSMFTGPWGEALRTRERKSGCF
jgi:hypothetical protein